MTIGAWLILFAVAAAAAAVSWIIMRLLPRFGRWLPIALPILFFIVLWPLSVEVLKHFVTCDAPDCGPLEFVAVLMVASLIAVSGLIGSIAGVAIKLRMKH